MIKQMAKEYFIIVMVQYILVNGKMINSMDKVHINGQMELNMMDILIKEKNIIMVHYI